MNLCPNMARLLRAAARNDNSSISHYLESPLIESLSKGRRYDGKGMLHPMMSQQEVLYMNSTDNQRTENNTTRHQYRTLTDAEKSSINSIKEKTQALIDEIKKLGTGREYSIAITNYEQACMWAVKGITA